MFAPVQTYQRGVVALIKASGARVAVLRDSRLLEYWRRYSQECYARLSIEANREEVFRYITWLNGRPGINEEIVAAMHDAVAQTGSIRARSHGVRALNGQWLVERRLF